MGVWELIFNITYLNWTNESTLGKVLYFLGHCRREQQCLPLCCEVVHNVSNISQHQSVHLGRTRIT